MTGSTNAVTVITEGSSVESGIRAYLKTEPVLVVDLTITDSVSAEII